MLKSQYNKETGSTPKGVPKMRKIFIDYNAAVDMIDKMCEDTTAKENMCYWLGLMNAVVALHSLLGNKQTATFVDVEEGEAQK